MFLRIIDLDLINVRATVPNFSTARSTIEFHPGGGARQWMLQFFQVELPIADGEVEICCPSRKAPSFDASFVGETACAHVRLDCEKRNATAATAQRLIRPRKVIVRFFFI